MFRHTPGSPTISRLTGLGLTTSSNDHCLQKVKCSALDLLWKGALTVKNMSNGKVHDEEVNNCQNAGGFLWLPVYPSSSPWILSHKEHIVIGAITELLSALPGSAGLKGNGYRLQQQSPSDRSHVTPLFPGKNAREPFS